MKKEEGRTRCVFVFNRFVIKVAKIYWLNILKILYFEIGNKMRVFKNNRARYFKTKSEKEEIEKDRIQKENESEMKILAAKNYEIFSTMSNFLLEGIMANLQERRFYKETKNPFCMPTYFSFFGLFNIQKKGESVGFWGRNEVWGYVYHNSKNSNQPFCDAHTLSEIENYGMDNGRLKLVDYGSRQVGEYLKINGQTLFNNFKHLD